MRRFLLFLCLTLSFASSRAISQVSISESQTGWELSNGQIKVELTRSSHGVRIKSLHREGGAEWAVADTPLVAFPQKDDPDYKYSGSDVSDLPKDGKELTLRFESRNGAQLSLMLKLYPSGAVVQLATQIENRGRQDLSLDPRIDPLFLTLRNPAAGLKPYSSAAGKHGFQLAGTLAGDRQFDDWVVLENAPAGESVLIGGEPGIGILGWAANTHALPSGMNVRAGTILIKNKKNAAPAVFTLSPGKKVETPITFIALAKGDTDNVGNEAFRYLKRYVFLPQLPDAPWVTYCIWLTEKDSEETLLKELKFAKQVGFDVYYHDATWFKGASIVPAMNDWTMGLGNYEESLEKFPHGLKKFTEAIHDEGLKTGVWVDPGNVDASLVESGEIPRDWVAMLDGKEKGTLHPSLTPTKQLCMGDPKVVAWIEKKLGDIIEKWHLDWIKWDPSATPGYECDRTDHGHGRTDGAYAAFRGRQEILRYLLERFPNLAGFECDPSLYYARTNPGPQGLLPGGYTNVFVTGPMLSPHVWGSLAADGDVDANGDNLNQRWYSASALDYYFRKHFTHGVTFGNINGMTSQMLSNAPPGFIEAFKRNLFFFKQYRHLLLEDVYHPKLSVAGWSAIQYVTTDPSESVLFVFRDHSDIAKADVPLRGLDPNAKYKVTSLNDRPGRDRVMTGDALMKGISFTLPDKWLSTGDSPVSKEFENQSKYGSDILMLKRLDQ